MGDHLGTSKEGQIMTKHQGRNANTVEKLINQKTPTGQATATLGW